MSRNKPDRTGSDQLVESDNSQQTLGFDKDRAFLLLSSLHKLVRRNLPQQAMVAARELFLMQPDVFWAEVKTIAVEDVAQPTEIIAVDVLYRQWRELSKDDRLGKGLLWGLDAVKILAEGLKDRRADELIHLFKSKPESWLLTELKNWDPELRDAIYDKHTLEGRKAGKGYKHFLERGSKTENKHPGYAVWRGYWEEEMKDAGK